MTNKEYIEELKKRRSFFQNNFPMIKIGRKRIDVNSYEIMKNSCPVCGYLTLSERDNFDICGICFWEDDGIEDFEADKDSGPNHMTLTEGRTIFFEAKNQLINSTFAEGDFRQIIQQNFIKLDGFIKDNETTELPQIQRLLNEILDQLKKYEIYGLEKLFT